MCASLPKQLIFPAKTSTKKLSVGQLYTLIQEVYSETFAKFALKNISQEMKMMIT